MRIKYLAMERDSEQRILRIQQLDHTKFWIPTYFRALFLNEAAKLNNFIPIASVWRIKEREASWFDVDK